MGNRGISAFTLALAVIGCGGRSNTTNNNDGASPPGDDAPSAMDDAFVQDDAGEPGHVDPPPAIDPVEPVWEPDKVEARIKSPNQRMHFTVGLPFRILADANDPKQWQCPPGHPPYVCSDSSMMFLIDGAPVGSVPPDPNGQNMWELRLPGGLTAGDHVLTVRFTPHAASAVDGMVPIYIHVDPLPAKTRTVNLTADVVLSGDQDLDWSDALVKGNGFSVRAAAGYSGKIVINDAFVTGLASFDNKLGIDVTTTGAVEITGSTFEATAPLHLVVNGSAPVTITNNELRANNYVTYVSSDPEKSPILDLAGSTSGAKVMQGNNIGAGIVRIDGMNGWQIGGLHDSQSNVFVGPRCVLELVGSSNAIVQGNYLHHDYYNGWSQGFNLQLQSGANGVLAEHNVIRDSSWPLQSFGGEFRYNLMLNSGHDFIRGGKSGAKFHHNILAHAQAPNSGFDGAVYLYSGEQNVVWDNNTLDAGGAVARYDAPALVLGSSGVSFASVRNNLFMNFSDAAGWAGKALIAGSDTEGSMSSPRIAKADYNAWSNPLADGTARYLSGIVAGTAGAHDVTAAPQLTGDVPQVPARIDEGSIWSRTYGVSQLLAYYRMLYTPAAGSPLIDKGDPADGAGTDIGAIGAGAAAAADKFGRVMDTN
jgi:hypothetical protein